MWYNDNANSGSGPRPYLRRLSIKKSSRTEHKFLLSTFRKPIVIDSKITNGLGVPGRRYSFGEFIGAFRYHL